MSRLSVAATDTSNAVDAPFDDARRLNASPAS